MEDILELMLGYRTLSPTKARKIHHLSRTPPEYWTAEERMLSGKARTRWLHEERKRAARGGSRAILDRIWPVGPYWPNGGVLAGGEGARREFREEVGRMRYRDQERAEAHARYYNVHPSDVLNLPLSTLLSLQSEGDWTRHESNQILNDLCQARRRHHHSRYNNNNNNNTCGPELPWRSVGRANPSFPVDELLQNGEFGAMVGAPSERSLYNRYGWDRTPGPFYAPDEPGVRGYGLDADARLRLFEAGNGLGPDWYRGGGGGGWGGGGRRRRRGRGRGRGWGRGWGGRGGEEEEEGEGPPPFWGR